jgi:hypothetical protein
MPEFIYQIIVEQALFNLQREFTLRQLELFIQGHIRDLLPPTVTIALSRSYLPNTLSYSLQ